MSDTITSLIDGNKRFRHKYFTQAKDHFEQLVLQGQKPKACVISCSDSRVNPDLIFNCKPGDLFTVRTVAALVPPFDSNDIYPTTGAALEFALTCLKVKHIILLGHTHCGGIQVVVERGRKRKGTLDSMMDRWLELAYPAYERVLKNHPQASFQEQVVLCGRYALIDSLNNVTCLPGMSNKEAQIHVWSFDLTTGKIDEYNQDNDCWTIV